MFRQTCVRIFPKLFLQNTTVSFSSVPLKEQFMKDLRNVRGCNSAERLLGELIYAKNIFLIPGTEPPPFFPDYKMHAYSNIQRIQHILQDEQPEYIMIDMIWSVLNESTINRIKATDTSSKNRLMSLLMNIRDIDVEYDLFDRKSTEFLKHILKDMECIISSCDKHSDYFRYCKQYPPGGLGLLQYVLQFKVTLYTDKLLNSIFQVGRAQLSFSESEKIKYGTLLVDTIEPVYNSIISMEKFYQGTDLFDNSWFKVRSALQFYIDIFAKFPAGNNTLLENFYMDKLNKSIQILDKNIRYKLDEAAESIAEEQVKYLFSLGCGNYEDFEKAGASEMPKSHTWWTECSTLLKKVNS